ncbi:membrane hypothetical protein [Candidatus Magnetomoraceae bacterium gMMP-15]
MINYDFFDMWSQLSEAYQSVIFMSITALLFLIMDTVIKRTFNLRLITVNEDPPEDINYNYYEISTSGSDLCFVAMGLSASQLCAIESDPLRLLVFILFLVYLISWIICLKLLSSHSIYSLLNFLKYVFTLLIGICAYSISFGSLWYSLSLR